MNTLRQVLGSDAAFKWSHFCSIPRNFSPYSGKYTYSFFLAPSLCLTHIILRLVRNNQLPCLSAISTATRCGFPRILLTSSCGSFFFTQNSCCMLSSAIFNAVTYYKKQRSTANIKKKRAWRGSARGAPQERTRKNRGGCPLILPLRQPPRGTRGQASTKR